MANMRALPIALVASASSIAGASSRSAVASFAAASSTASAPTCLPSIVRICMDGDGDTAAALLVLLLRMAPSGVVNFASAMTKVRGVLGADGPALSPSFSKMKPALFE